MTAPRPALLEAVAVMDRLRAPGGCPWDAEQTSRSLARYLVEETYEVLEAIETDDPVLLREELGDLLLQVLFHARLAEELPEGQRFSIEDVASDLVTKLIRRHPHVFAGGDAASSAQDVNEAWERRKLVEKGRTSAVDGVPLAQPALALTGKLVARARRAGLEGSEGDQPNAAAVAGPDPSSLGGRLFALVREAVDAGLDAETELRRAALAYRTAIRDAEHAKRAGGGCAPSSGGARGSSAVAR